MSLRVVVTGGGGYVGYHIGWALSRGGHHVTLLDVTSPDPEWRDTAPLALWDSLPEEFWRGEENQHSGSLEYVRGDITRQEDLERYFEGAAAVIHSASFGMSGREQLPPHAPQQEKVNVEGTREVIRAALTAKVRALVYTSTYNVVSSVHTIAEGDESMPLCPLYAHTDHYSRTKAIAEMLVLMADGKCGPPALSQPHCPVTSQPCLSPLRTCSLRINGVMGLGEKKHSQRIIDAIRSGILVLAYGRKDGLVDFIGIQNVVQAHVKALMALLREQSLSTQPLPAKPPNPAQSICSGRMQDSCANSEDSNSPSAVSSRSSISTNSHSAISSSEVSSLYQDNNGNEYKPSYAGHSQLPFIVLSPSVSTSKASSNLPLVSGQAFFISDSMPVSYFEYFQPLFEGLGYSFPDVTLPFWILLTVAYLQAFTYCLVYKFFPFSPLVTPAEALKSVGTHYCSSQKAMDAFNYSPTRPNDLKQILEYYKARGCTKTHKMGLVSLLPLAVFFVLSIFSRIIVH